jgi:tetratricopeptide (TPR) repeat protein
MIDNEKWVWFTEEEPIPSLFGRNPAEQDTTKALVLDAVAPETPKKPALSTGLVQAITLQLEGKSEDALKELAAAAELGDSLVEIHAAMGNIQFSLSRYVEAVKSYGKVAELEPRHRTVHYNVGLCLQRLGQWKDAETSFKKALEIDPKRIEARLGLAMCHLYLGRPEKALEMFDMVLRAKDECDKAHFGRAVALQMLRKYDQAELVYRKILPRYPDSEELMSNLIALGASRKDSTMILEFAEQLRRIRPDARASLEGLAQVALVSGEFETALKHLLKLVVVAPESFEAWFNLGAASHELDRLQDAEMAYIKAIELKPASDRAHANLGIVRQERGDFKGARDSYERALQFAPDVPGSLWNLAVVTERSGDPQSAGGLYQKLLQKSPGFNEARYRLGLVRLECGDYPGAIEALESCLAKKGDWADAHLALGRAFLLSGEAEKALKEFEKALELDPASVAAVQGLATVAVDMEDYERAYELQTKLIESGERSAELFYNTGLLLQKSGQNDEAAGRYREALAERPDLPEALLNLGHALKALGQEEEARSCWRTAVEANPDLASSYFAS